jgi:release factor glutamine methyltransferase
MYGLSLTVPPSVFHPKFYLSSRFFADHLRQTDLEGKEVLEIGCGSGILSLIAARKGARVTAVDVNPRAVECTSNNALTNHLEGNLQAYQSDLFDGLPANCSFDYVLWSPPFFPKDPTDNGGKAWNAGAGYEVIRRFAESAAAFLREGGCILFLLSSDSDRPSILSIFESCGFRMRVAQEKRKFFELLSIHAFHRSMDSR